MDMNDAMRSGLSLERDLGSASVRQPDRDSQDEMDILYFLVVIDRKRKLEGVTQEDIDYVTAVVRNQELSVRRRFQANQLLARCHSMRKDQKRALYYMEVARTLASTVAEQLACDRDIFLLQCLLAEGKVTEESLERYELFVEEAVKGILAQDEESIRQVLSDDTCDMMEDYAILAMAAKAWSEHPRNQDDFDREEAEAKYYRYIKAFKEQEIKGYTEPIYQYYHGKSCNRNNNEAAKWRKNLLQGKPAQQGIVMDKPSAAHSDSAAAAPTSPAVSEGDKIAIETLEELTRRTVGKNIDSIDGGLLDEYVMHMILSVIVEMKKGNAAVMRYVIEHSELFERMEDYVILGSAALLWFCHPDNKDVGEKLRAQTLGEQWIEKALHLSEPEENYPLYRRMRRESSLTWDERSAREEWRELLKLVFAKIKP